MSAVSDRTAVRLLALLYLVGGLLGLAAMLLPQPPTQDDTAIYLVLVTAIAIGCCLLGLAGWGHPLLLLFAALAGTTILITLGIHATGQPDSVYALFFVGMAVMAFYVLPRRAALGQVAIVALSYGLLMLHDQPPGGGERWGITVAWVLAVGLIVGAMRRRVESLVSELSASVDRLATAANTDVLTGLANRRGFDEQVERELARTRRGAPDFALVLCDLDHFKAINDAHGHPAGDRVLQRVADALRAGVRDVDTIARLGGEEFGVLLPATDETGALAAAERLRAGVAGAFPGDEDAVTMSCGVAAAAAHPSAEALLTAADTALYAAKRLGRDQAVVHRAHLAEMLRFELARDGEAERSPLRTVLALSEALDQRDPATVEHSATVARHAETIARALGFAPRRTAQVRLAGLLHDVGKVGVSDAALRKAGPLDAAEWREMRAHPEIGARMLGGVVGELDAWVLAHHERPDGTGYPQGLKADDIPLEARILAVADSYEAMTADRPYRRAIGPAAAARELRAHAGTQFDADVVERFLRALGERDDAQALTPA